MTEEMLKVIQSEERRIMIQAFAGTGKSSTMIEYIKSHKAERIVYVVYNKSMKKEFDDKLRGHKHNCTVSTVHSLAYKWYLSQGYPKRPFKNISIIDIKNVLKSRLEYPQLSKVNFYFNMYLTSDYEKPTDMLPVTPEDKVYFKFVEKLWEYYRVKSEEMTHNIYLKMYQLAKVKIDCETLIFDEFNDVNGVMLDIVVNNLDKKVIIVGDRNQSIQSFNFTVDGLTIMKEKYDFKEYTLTKSFRVSEDIAELSSRYLSFMNDEKIKFNGVGKTKRGRLNLFQADSKRNQIHLLCRTKLGGLKEIVEVLSKEPDKKIYYVSGLEGFGIREIERILSYRGTVYIGGEKFHINELRKMLKEGVDDPEISRICSIYNFVEKNEDIVDILKMSEVTKKEYADIVLLTSHVSKGLTLDNTLLGRDFPPIEDVKQAMIKSKDGHPYIHNLSRSEMCLLFVAMTRATGVLDLGTTLTKKQLLKEGDKIEGDLESGSTIKAILREANQSHF